MLLPDSFWDQRRLLSQMRSSSFSALIPVSAYDATIQSMAYRLHADGRARLIRPRSIRR